MSDREIVRAIRARLHAATPGPWGHDSHGFIAPPEHDGEWGETVAKIPAYSTRTPTDRANAEFIAHAPEDIAYLLSRVEAAGERPIGSSDARIAELEMALAPLVEQDCESWGCSHAPDNRTVLTCVIERARAALAGPVSQGER